MYISKTPTTMSTPNLPTSSTPPPQTHDISKIAQLIEHLDTAQGTCQCLVSLILPPTKPISQVAQRLKEELSRASKVPHRLHRLARMIALTSASQQLLCHSELPPNGLIVYCGEVVGNAGREELIRVQFEPWKKVGEFEYHVDERFHTGAMKGMLGAAVLKNRTGEPQGPERELVSQHVPNIVSTAIQLFVRSETQGLRCRDILDF
jgi:hypothetical protein